MLDPLSLAVSIVALVEAADKAISVIQKLVKLRSYVSETMQALNNEMSTMHLLIRSIDSALIDRSEVERRPCLNSRGHQISTEKPDQMESLHMHLDVAKDKLLAMERMLAYELKKADGSPDYYSWLRSEKPIKRLQKDMKSAREGLVQSVEVLNLSVNREPPQIM